LCAAVRARVRLQAHSLKREPCVVSREAGRGRRGTDELLRASSSFFELLRASSSFFELARALGVPRYALVEESCVCLPWGPCRIEVCR